MSRTILVIPALLAALFASAQPQEAGPQDIPNLDRFIGRPLAQDNRAARADILRTLPLSCPPFYLRDEFGRIIDPKYAEREGLPEPIAPVSPKQTCNFCHDYNRVTQGYHFQTGYDELYESQKLGEPTPLHKSPGFYGKWQLLYQREIAPKSFQDPSEIDLTPFEWMRDCGICHPGGGPAEYDRSGKRYSDVMGAERDMANLLDGDYYGARWDKTGVMEADCFICHLETYEYSSRAQQIKRGNYKWAATAAAGFGYVRGAVDDNDVPVVEYRKEIFGPDGKVALAIRRPTDRQCMFCHDMSGVQKRGTTWHNVYTQDAHSQQGIRCIDCHQGDIRHNYTKGYSSSQSVRDDLDGTTASCKGCHDSGELGAPYFNHRGIPPIHLKRLSCEACHITKRPFLSALTVDSLTGKVIELPNQPEPLTGETHAFGATWGKLTGEEQVFAPFTAREIEKAASLFVPAKSPLRQMFLEEDGTCRLPAAPFVVRDFLKGDLDPPTVHTEDARALMLRALEQTASLEETDSVVCVYRGKAYHIGADGLEELPTTLQPKRVGAISESPVTYARSKKDGLIYPEAYQLGVFWAYVDQGVARPLHIGEMKAAWDFLYQDQYRENLVRELGSDKAWGILPQEEYRFYLYPARPSSAAELPPLPEPATVSESELREAIQARLDAYGPEDRQRLEVYDDNNDRWPEVNTEQEIQLMGWALTQTAKRLPEPQLYYIRGASLFRVTVEQWANPYAGTLTDMPAIPDKTPFLAIERHVKREEQRGEEERRWWEHAETRLARLYTVNVEPVDPNTVPSLADLAQRLPWTISHGVEPAEMALGAKGCADCHATDAHFFFGEVTVDPFGPDGRPITAPMWELLGYNPAGLRLGAWREHLLKPATPWVILSVALLMLVHLTLFGSQSSPAERITVLDVLRFGTWERLSHLLVMVSMVFLAVTGFLFLLGKNEPLGEPVADYARYLHALLGFVATAGVLGIFLVWVRSMVFARGDAKWLAGVGGYLGGHKKYPAGKFNAGQKLLFWLSVVVGFALVVTGILMYLYRDVHMSNQELIYTIHDAAALAMIVMMLGHVYLAVIVNPHALHSLFGGKVSERWVKEHHPDWKIPRSHG